MNAGYIAVGQGEFDKAREEFGLVISSTSTNVDGNTVVAANNLALMHVYEGQLYKAIKFLEDFIGNNITHIQAWESIIFNLCTLYDLAWNDSIDKKCALLRQVKDFLTDDFDLSIFKIPEIPQGKGN